MTDNLRGALLMICAMGGFAVEDMALKAAAQTIPIGQAVAIFGFLGFVIYALIAKSQNTPVLHPAILKKTMILRSLSEIAGRLFYALAIALIPLSNASAILQATPFVVTLGAAMIFKEHISRKSWLAIFVGFLGVLMVLRPGLEGFQAASVFAVLGMLGFAGRDLATRASPISMTTAQLGVIGFLVLTLSGLILLLFQGSPAIPDLKESFFIAGATAFGLIGYSALTLAMRTGQISIVAPFRYSRLLFGVLFGMLVFHEDPDNMTLIGSVIIVGSGLLLISTRKTKS